MQRNSNSFLKRYTTKDLRLLNDLIDPITHNLNKYSVSYYPNKDSKGTLLNPELIAEMSDQEVVNALNRIIHFLAPAFKEDILINIMYIEPMQKMPLYINRELGMSIIAKWRLIIGK
jgi:hypothetical protein